MEHNTSCSLASVYAVVTGGDNTISADDDVISTPLNFVSPANVVNKITGSNHTNHTVGANMPSVLPNHEASECGIAVSLV